MVLFVACFHSPAADTKRSTGLAAERTDFAPRGLFIHRLFVKHEYL